MTGKKYLAKATDLVRVSTDVELEAHGVTARVYGVPTSQIAQILSDGGTLASLFEGDGELSIEAIAQKAPQAIDYFVALAMDFDPKDRDVLEHVSFIADADKMRIIEGALSLSFPREEDMALFFQTLGGLIRAARPGQASGKIRTKASDGL